MVRFINKVIEYFLITGIMTLFYYPVLIPLLIAFGMSWTMIGEYLFAGFCFDLMLAYILAKTLIRIYPRIQKISGTFIEPIPKSK